MSEIKKYYEITDIKTPGYYQAFYNGQKINRDGHSGNHRNIHECEQTIFWHLQNADVPEGKVSYEIRKPSTILEADVSLIILGGGVGGGSTVTETAVTGKLAWGDVGHTGVLTAFTGSGLLTTPGITYTDLDFSGRKILRANNLTFRNCRFTDTAVSGSSYLIDGNSFSYGFDGPFLFEDCTFLGADKQILMGGNVDVTFRRCQFRDPYADLLRPYGGTWLFEDCFFGPHGVTGTSSHADSTQVIGAPDMSFTRCTWDCPSPTHGEPVETGFPIADSWSGRNYKGDIGQFWDEGGGTGVYTDCHFVRATSTAIQIGRGTADGSPQTASLTLSGCRFYLGIINIITDNSNEYKIGSSAFPHSDGIFHGNITDNGGNQWAETGTTTGGDAVTAGQSITFTYSPGGGGGVSY